MRSTSECRWVRAKNTVGQATKITQWHAIIPGHGSLDVPPGTACDTALVGSLQFASDVEVVTLDGRRHPECVAMAGEFFASIDPSPGPREPDPEHHTFAPPGSQSKK